MNVSLRPGGAAVYQWVPLAETGRAGEEHGRLALETVYYVGLSKEPSPLESS